MNFYLLPLCVHFSMFVYYFTKVWAPTMALQRSCFPTLTICGVMCPRAEVLSKWRLNKRGCRAADDVLARFMLGLHHEKHQLLHSTRPPHSASRHELLICSRRTTLKRQIAAITYAQSLASAETNPSKVDAAQTALDCATLKVCQSIKKAQMSKRRVNKPPCWQPGNNLPK